MADDLKEALALLRRKRAAAHAVVEKYDRALTALLAIEAGEEEAVDMAPPVQAVPTLVAPAPRLSVLAMAKNLLDEADQLWTVATIIAEYANRGTPIDAADPANALRTALATLVKRGEAHRESPGYFRSAKYQLRLTEQGHSDEPAVTLAVDGSERLTGS